MFYCKPFAHIFFNCSLIHLQNSVLLSIAFFILRTPDTLIVYLVFDILDILTAVFILRFYLFTSFWLLLGWASFRVTFFAIPFLLNYVSFWVAPSSFTLLLHCQWALLFLLGLSEYLQHQFNYLAMALLVFAFSWAMYNAWKVSVFRVILVRILPYLDWIRRDTPYLFLFSPNSGKCGPE